MILEKNVFVERVLPGSVLRGLTEAEIAVYGRPFAEPGEARRPTLTWPRKIPLDGAPADVAAIVQSYAEWLAKSERSEALRQRRARRDPDRPPTGVLPQLAQSDRGHGQRQPLRPGGLAGRDRAGARRLVPWPRVTLPPFNSADRRPLSRTRRTAAAPSCRQRATPGSRRRRRSRPQGRSRRRCWRARPRRGCRGCVRSAPARC